MDTERRGRMSLTQLKQAAANLPVKKQRELIAYLVARQTKRDEAFKKVLADRIDDRDPDHWMELNDAKKRYGWTTSPTARSKFWP